MFNRLPLFCHARVFQFARIAFCFLLGVLLTGFLKADEPPLEPDAVDKNYAVQLPRIEPTEPEHVQNTFQIADGFRIELIAAEPLVADPVAIAFDEYGAMFVVEMRGYSEHAGDHLGSVKRLVDSDGDGRYDRGSDYLTGLSWPTAVACYDGGVFVGAAPDIFYCKDTDGDGVADEKRKVFTGFGKQNVLGLLNSFNWGLDNRLYGSASSNGGTILHVGKPDVPPVNLRRQDFVIEPKSMTMSSVSGGAQHGLSFDRAGNRYVCSNSDHIQLIEFEERYLQRNPHMLAPPNRRSIAEDGASAEVYRASPVEPWRIVRTRLRVKGLVGGPVEGGGRAAGYFTSATGVTLYRGDAFPNEYREHDFAIIGDVGGNLIHRKRVDDQGLSKIARRIDEKSEFITSTDTWFRPVQFANAPDGTLFAVDFYREVIEHPLSLPPMIKKHLDLDSGNGRGRIYRIAPMDFKYTKRQMLGDASLEELVAMLEHSNDWHRETAARLIVDGKATNQLASEISQRLQRLMASSKFPFARIRALYCLASLDQLGRSPLEMSAIEAGLNDSNSLVRRHAIQVAERYSERFPSLAQRLATMVDQAGNHERLQLALTLGSFPAADRRRPLASIIRKDVAEPKVRAAVLSSIADDRVTFLSELIGDQQLHASTAGVDLILELARQIGASKTKSDVANAITLLQISKFENADHAIAELLVGLGLRDDRLRQFLMDAKVPNVASIPERVAAATKRRVMSSDASTAERTAAVARLRILNWSHAQPALVHATQDGQPIELRMAAIRTIGQFRNIDAGQLLVQSAPSLSPTLRRAAFDALLSRATWIELVFTALENDEMKPTDLTSVHRQQLTGHANAEIREKAKTFFSENRGRAEVLADYQQILKMSGNVESGRKAFQKTCSTCHQLDQIGQNVGPDLQPLRNRGAAFMLTNIIAPNREVDARYESYTVVTDDARSINGIVTAETPASIELTQPDGKKVEIPRPEIENMRSTGLSLMPEGLERELDYQQMADLIAYLISI